MWTFEQLLETVQYTCVIWPLRLVLVSLTSPCQEGRIVTGKGWVPDLSQSHHPEKYQPCFQWPVHESAFETVLCCCVCVVWFWSVREQKRLIAVDLNIVKFPGVMLNRYFSLPSSGEVSWHAGVCVSQQFFEDMKERSWLYFPDCNDNNNNNKTFIATLTTSAITFKLKKLTFVANLQYTGTALEVLCAHDHSNFIRK